VFGLDKKYTLALFWIFLDSRNSFQSLTLKVFIFVKGCWVLFVTPIAQYASCWLCAPLFTHWTWFRRSGGSHDFGHIRNCDVILQEGC